MDNTPKRSEPDDARITPAALGGGAAAGQSLAASEVNEDVIELQTKIAALVAANYGGDYKRAFDHYDADRVGISADELKQLLADADIGNLFTRGSWVSGIMDRLDVNQDGRIGWDEFEQAVKNSVPSGTRK